MIILFLPKEGVYYTLEDEMNRSNININGELYTPKIAGFSVENGAVMVNDVNGGRFQKITLFSLGFYNSLDIENITVDDGFLNILPPSAKTIKLTQHIFRPTQLNIVADGDFGQLKGSVDLMSKKIKLILEPSILLKSRYKHLLVKFHKTEEGLVYESNF